MPVRFHTARTALVASLGIAAATATPLANAEVRLDGSGASFPFPIYAKWFKDFSAETDDVRIDYRAS